VRIKVPKKKFQVCIPRDSNSDLQRWCKGSHHCGTQRHLNI
jgi:hypothetical protein